MGCDRKRGIPQADPHSNRLLGGKTAYLARSDGVLPPSAHQLQRSAHFRHNHSPSPCRWVFVDRLPHTPQRGLAGVFIMVIGEAVHATVGRLVMGVVALFRTHATIRLRHVHGLQAVKTLDGEHVFRHRPPLSCLRLLFCLSIPPLVIRFRSHRVLLPPPARGGGVVGDTQAFRSRNSVGRYSP